MTSRPLPGTPSRLSWAAADEEALLTSMLTHFTPSGAERPLSEWLAAQMAPLGFETAVDAVGNLIAQLPATHAAPGAPCVLLGHLDTVAGEVPVRREGERLYGRGAVDAKGPLAAFLAAAARLATSTQRRYRSIIIVGAAEEETATSRGARAVLGHWRPAYAIIGEPSGASALTLGYKGRLLVSYRIAAPVAHTARPEESVCARGSAFWQIVYQAADRWNSTHVSSSESASHFALLMPSLRAIRSGSDGFTDWCELEIGYRLPPQFDIAALEAWLTSQAAADGAQVAFRGAEPAYRAPRHGPLVSAFMRAMRAEGMGPTFKLKTGTSDMNVVGPIWNCPILAYGPGDASLDHTPDEHINLAEYHQGVAVLERVLADLVSKPEQGENQP
jgi:N-acetyl-ornithine/N-acetyl-lysine deacetylase